MNRKENYLIEGDNLQVLNLLAPKFKGSIDLIYIDPPYASNQDFTVSKGRNSTISREKSGTIAYKDKFDLNSYLSFLRPRLELAKTLLSNKGSIYLHIDYKVGHYVKVLMDEVFGFANFKADITRIKCNPKNFKRRNYGNIKDCILFYTKTDNYIWNEVTDPYSQEDIERLFPKRDSEGRRYTTVPLHAPGETNNGSTGKAWKGMFPPKGRHWRCSPLELDKLDHDGLVEWSNTGNPRKIIFAKDKIKQGKKVQDLWEFKDKPTPIYPTEKNALLLQRILKASSSPDSIVMDFFAGSGSFLEVAHGLGRFFIGVDSSKQAIKTIAQRFHSYQLTESEPYLFFDLASLEDIIMTSVTN